MNSITTINMCVVGRRWASVCLSASESEIRQLCQWVWDTTTVSMSLRYDNRVSESEIRQPCQWVCDRTTVSMSLRYDNRVNESAIRQPCQWVWHTTTVSMSLRYDNRVNESAIRQQCHCCWWWHSSVGFYPTGRNFSRHSLCWLWWTYLICILICNQSIIWRRHLVGIWGKKMATWVPHFKCKWPEIKKLRFRKKNMVIQRIFCIYNISWYDIQGLVQSRVTSAGLIPPIK